MKVIVQRDQSRLNYINIFFSNSTAHAKCAVTCLSLSYNDP